MFHIIICLATATAILLTSIYIGHFWFRIFPIAHPVLMYYKIDLKKRKIAVISAFTMHRETLLLKKNSFRLIFLSELEAFGNKEGQLPCESYFIAVHELYSRPLQKALPLLLNQCISIHIYLPIIISPNNSQYQQQTVQQLNEFIFSKEFKNTFGYD